LRVADARGRPLGGQSRLVEADDEAAASERVPVVAVDDVVGAGRNVSALHLDIEGSERAALAGALETLRRCRPLLVLEILDDGALLDDAWFADHILPLGYRRTGSLRHNAVLQCPPPGAA
jgi:hypothetical protein